MTVATQLSVSFQTPGLAATMLVVYAGVAILGSGVVATAYRMYFNESVSEGISAIVGVSIVVIYLNTASLGTIVGGGELDLLEFDVVLFNVVALGAATLVTPIGQRIGDRIGRDLVAVSGVKQIEGEVSAVVRSVGRVTPLTLPDEIADVESYDPVTDEKKAELAGRTLLFPRGLTVEELRTRLTERLKKDYGVGYVDVDVTEAGTVEYLALGSRAAGIGSTLAPGQVAIALQADPAFSATPGDSVQVWTDGDDPERVLTAELRATAGDVATIAVDEDDAELVDDGVLYRLVTLPADTRHDRVFASILRGADETMAIVTVAPDSPLDGIEAGSLGAIVIAIESDDGTIDTLPERTRTLRAGETVYVVGRPDVLRRIEEQSRRSDDRIETDDTDPGDGSTPTDNDSVIETE